MYCQRTLEFHVKRAATQFPALLVTGARQVGKTTVLRRLAEADRRYVTLDDPTLRNLAQMEPALFLQRFPPPLLLDEIQYAPQLLPYIKMLVDSNPVMGAYWLTGSQQFQMMKGVSESLAGRVGVIRLLGLSYAEILGHGTAVKPFLPTGDRVLPPVAPSRLIPLPDVYRMIWRGTYPGIALYDDMDWDLYYTSYVQTYLERDVQDLTKVGSQMSFLRFVRAAAARTSQLLNFSDLARDADISVNTAKSWVSILEASGIVFLMEPYFNNLTKRLVKSPKLYFLDTGLCSWLTQWSSPQTLESGAMSGAIFETWVVTELLKGYAHCGQRPPFYFYRDKDQKEIDLLIYHDGTLYPLEIKKTASPKRDDLRHFSVLNHLGVPIGPGGLICLAPAVMPVTADVSAFPAWLL